MMSLKDLSTVKAKCVLQGFLSNVRAHKLVKKLREKAFFHATFQSSVNVTATVVYKPLNTEMFVVLVKMSRQRFGCLLRSSKATP